MNSKILMIALFFIIPSLHATKETKSRPKELKALLKKQPSSNKIDSQKKCPNACEKLMKCLVFIGCMHLPQSPRSPLSSDK